MGAGHPRQDQDGDQQTRDDDHQLAYARRSHRQQRGVRRDGRYRGAREHEGEHGKDGRLQGRQGAVSAVEDLQGQDDA